MTVKVIQKFIDKDSFYKYEVGDVVEFPANRVKELKGLVEEIKPAKK